MHVGGSFHHRSPPRESRESLAQRLLGGQIALGPAESASSSHTVSSMTAASRSRVGKFR